MICLFAQLLGVSDNLLEFIFTFLKRGDDLITLGGVFRVVTIAQKNRGLAAFFEGFDVFFERQNFQIQIFPVIVIDIFIFGSAQFINGFFAGLRSGVDFRN